MSYTTSHVKTTRPPVFAAWLQCTVMRATIRRTLCSLHFKSLYGTFIRLGSGVLYLPLNIFISIAVVVINLLQID